MNEQGERGPSEYRTLLQVVGGLETSEIRPLFVDALRLLSCNERCLAFLESGGKGYIRTWCVLLGGSRRAPETNPFFFTCSITTAYYQLQAWAQYTAPLGFGRLDEELKTLGMVHSRAPSSGFLELYVEAHGLFVFSRDEEAFLVCFFLLEGASSWKSKWWPECNE